MTGPLHALSIQQPWCWAILHAAKQIENRPWAPWRALCGQRIAIHASKGVDATGWPALSEIVGGGVPSAGALTKGAIVGTARLVGAARILPLPDPLPGDPRVAVGDRQGHLDEFHCSLIATSPYSSGPWCWVLEDVVELPRPVPAKGALALWRVPAQLAADVLEQEARVGLPAEPTVEVPGRALVDRSRSLCWRLPTGREVWIPKSQILAETHDSLTVTRWLAQREQLHPEPRGT